MTASTASPRRIFVVGVPRSGTTLVQSFLAAHSHVTSFTESHFWSRHFRPLPRPFCAVLVRDPGPRVRDFLDENRNRTDPARDRDEGQAGPPGAGRPAPIEDDRSVSERRELAEAARSRRRAPSTDWPPGWVHDDAPSPLIPRGRLPFRTHRVSRQFLGLLDDLAGRRRAGCWVEKTPRHLRFVPFLKRLDPSIHVVHVVRDGLETVASLHTASKRWERPYDLDTCVARWNDDVAFTLRRLGRPNEHIVLYEHLTADPEAVMTSLFRTLGLPWEPEVLTRYRDSGTVVVTSDEPWKDGVRNVVRPSATSPRVLTEPQRERALATLRRDLYAEIEAAS